MVADLLNVKVIEVRDQVNLFERFIPRVYNSRISAMIRLGVCHKYVKELCQFSRKRKLPYLDLVSS